MIENHPDSIMDTRYLDTMQEWVYSETSCTLLHAYRS